MKERSGLMLGERGILLPVTAMLMGVISCFLVGMYGGERVSLIFPMPCVEGVRQLASNANQSIITHHTPITASSLASSSTGDYSESSPRLSSPPPSPSTLP